jgi:hypothetical protein
MKTTKMLLTALVLRLFAFAGDGAETQITADATEQRVRAALKGVQQEERLKGEVLPALGYRLVAEGKAVQAGKSYSTEERDIMLFPLLEKFAVELRDAKRPTGEVLKQIRLATGKEGGITLEPSIRDDAVIFFEFKEKIGFADMGHMLQKLARTDSFKRVGYVYINEETGKEVALTGKLVVRLKRGEDKDALLTFAGANNLALIEPMHGSKTEFVLELNAAFTDPVLEICQRLGELDYVEWASPDFLFRLELHSLPNDPLFSDEWHLHNTGQSGAQDDADIDAPEAWERLAFAPGAGADIVIAIIDTGVQTTHPDLSIFANQAEQNGTTGVDDDGNGYVDDVNGWDFYHNDNDPNPGLTTNTTTTAHGTACAGIAAAIGNNSLGVAGVAFNCQILPVKIQSDGGVFATSANIAQGIRYAADMADVLSNSWGGGGDNATVHSAIQYAVNTMGRPVFCSSGNDADGTGSDPCWLRCSLNLGSSAAGNRYFKWTYRKDDFLSVNEDSVWLDDIVFPDNSTEGFEGSSFPPGGWSTGGTTSWIQYGESKHVRGTGRYSAKSGDIGDSQETWLQSPRKTVENDDVIQFWAWIDCEKDNDYLRVEVENLGYADYQDAGTAIYDVEYPARYSECIAVGACTDFDYRSQYSQYDESLNDVLDIVAPSNGGNWGIATTDLTGSAGYDSGDYTNASGSSAFGGTSAACPLAAGCAALLLSKQPALTPTQIRNLLTSTADKIGSVNYVNGYNKYYGYGRININAALNALPPAVYFVPDDYSKIQDAIDASADGDFVVVFPGVYLENINFLGKNITLRSTGPTTPTIVNNTFIDGYSRGPVVTFSGTETADCVLSGFTIAYGSASGVSGNGTHATIENNVIRNNSSFGGGGISMCDGIIKDNQIHENAGVFGGGLANCHGTIRGNSIWGNSNSGILDCDGIIEDNVISSNESNIGGGLAHCDGTIRDNVISFNTAEYDGGGLWICNATIENNIIYANEAKVDAGAGGGLLGCGGTIQNNIIYDNKARIGGGLDDCNGSIQNNTIYGNTAEVSGGGLLSCLGTIRNCVIWNNIAPSDPQIGSSSAPSYCCIQDWSGGTGNISAEPQLFSPGYPARDFHLRSTSPCIDAGVRIDDLSQDYEGDARGYDGTSEARGDGSDFDIGADEFVRTVTAYNFEAGTEGWGFSSQVIPFSPPNSAAFGGALWLGTVNNTNCFGYWQSPSSAVPVSSGQLYLARFALVCSDQAQSLVPTLRVRAVSSNFQQVDWLENSSTGGGESSPNSAGRSYDLFFEPPANASSVSPAFDVLNFDPSDAEHATVGLDALNVYAYSVSEIAVATTQKQYAFDTGAEGWVFSGEIPPFTQLNTGAYSGALHLASQNNTNSFGYWYSPESDVSMTATPTLYRATFSVYSDQSDASIVPEMRLRVYASNYQITIGNLCTSAGAGDNSPMQTARSYSVYFWSPNSALSGNLQCAFDLLNFSPDDAAHGTLSLDDVKIETVNLPWYP